MSGHPLSLSLLKSSGEQSGCIDVMLQLHSSASFGMALKFQEMQMGGGNRAAADMTYLDPTS